MDSNLSEMIPRLAIFFGPFLFALCFHEFAHGWVAMKKGDNTAKLMGRLTLNPFAHMDLIGTVVLPMVAAISGWAMFGWAKPVPVNPRNLKNPVEDMFWIALAGPLSNILLAFVGSIFWVGLTIYGPAFGDVSIGVKLLNAFIYINVLLAVFNMIPIHPLDGGKVLARFLPSHWNDKMEEHQQMMSMVLFGFFILGGFRYLSIPVYTLTQLIMGSVVSVFQAFS